MHEGLSVSLLLDFWVFGKEMKNKQTPKWNPFAD